MNDRINENIRDINGRYLLLELKPSLSILICRNIIVQNPNKAIILYEGIPFEEDNNKDYIKII